MPHIRNICAILIIIIICSLIFSKRIEGNEEYIDVSHNNLKNIIDETITEYNTCVNKYGPNICSGEADNSLGPEKLIFSEDEQHEVPWEKCTEACRYGVYKKTTYNQFDPVYYPKTKMKELDKSKLQLQEKHKKMNLDKKRHDDCSDWYESQNSHYCNAWLTYNN